jgi:hypothetical protein
MKNPSIENEKIKHINFLMDELHDSLNNIYELLVDNEFDECSDEITSLIKSLRSILDSIKEDL